ncbi:MAG TPA: tetratricopeptide repeat protein [Silvibacterium sp.]|nr:tetratricopeptide repeat protein [Silvibacterium sp.]
MPDARQETAKAKQPRVIAGRSRPASNPTLQQSLAHFQSAVQLMQEGKFEKARLLFEKLSEDGTPELLERSRVYLAVCCRHAKKEGLAFATPEEQYDYAISLLNTGNYEDARDQFDGLLRNNSDTDYAHYGLAVLNSITGQAEECLDHLARAINLNPQNRIQARSDSDFNDMADDPRFTELLYPEA